MIGIVFCV